MDIRYLVVGAPFIIAFFYTLYWLRKWGAFSSTNNMSKKMTQKNESIDQNYILENIFLKSLLSKILLFLSKLISKDL